MTEKQIIKDLEFHIDLTDAGLLRHLKKFYPDKDGRKYRKWIRQARENCKQKKLQVKPPYELAPDELEIWILVMDLLDRSILEPIDHLVLADYCREKAMYYKLFASIKDLPNFGEVTGKNGQPYQHPRIGQSNKKQEICQKIEHKFGFDPSGRRKNKYEKKKNTQSTLTALLKNPSKSKAG